ncbi:MAG: tandem-95 repeat protein [Anaerolineae bacterium]|nr:tandem-95 repeat protein [Anaerolineae bacterium]
MNTFTSSGVKRRTAVLVVALDVCLVLPAMSVLAQPRADLPNAIIVTSFNDDVNDDGICSLREAIMVANDDKSGGRRARECGVTPQTDTNTIYLPSGTYALTRTDSGNEDSSSTGDLDTYGDLAILTPAEGATITAGAGFKDRVFHVFGGTVRLSGLAITGGNVLSGDGGAIYNGGTLSLTNVTLSGNKAQGMGGAMFNAGTLSLSHSTISQNQAASGGAIAGTSAAVTTVGNSILSGNSAAVGPVCAGSLASAGGNFFSDLNGCAVSGLAASDRVGVDPLLGPLQNNGGQTLTYALSANSPAIDAGTCTDPAGGSVSVDQRGVARPVGASCDSGAYEHPDPAQTGPVFTVNTTADSDNGCTVAECSLREAINAANARANDEGSTDAIQFNIPGSGPFVIQPGSPLPGITDPVSIDGTTQPGGIIEVDGAAAGEGADGLAFNSSGSSLTSVAIHGFDGAGVVTMPGVTVSIRGGAIRDNGDLGIDLSDDGLTVNDLDESDGVQNAPVLFRATPNTGTDQLIVDGRLRSLPDAAYDIDLYNSTTCDPSTFGEGEGYLGTVAASTDARGDMYFSASLSPAVALNQYITATATSADGATSEFSQCVPVSADNDSWPRALPVTPGDAFSPAIVDQPLALQGQARWYRFPVQPNSTVIVTLTNLPANYDLTVYKDIAAAYQQLTTESQPLETLGAEFAPAAFAPAAFAPAAFADANYAPAAFAPAAFAPAAFAPAAFAPAAFAPAAFAPAAFAPAAFAPAAFAPAAFAPDAYSPAAFAPAAFAPAAFAPAAFAPAAFAPAAFAPAAFAAAQTSSLIGISAFEGTSGEGIILNTWNNTGDFYVRVLGRDGAFSLNNAFHLEVRVLTGACTDVSPIPAGISGLQAEANDYHTVILTDTSRMQGTAEEKAALQARLSELAARPEVAGVIVDVSQDGRVAAANQQADAGDNYACPYAKNLVADEIKGIVDRYRALNPLEYVVIVGNDDVIPFYRYPDNALLGPESQFVPPVSNFNASRASLELNYVLGQDQYGSPDSLSIDDSSFPLLGLAVGRLVETPSDAVTQIDAYLDGTIAGVIPAPDSSLVTGYDFLADAATAVQSELEAGTGQAAETLINPREVSPADPASWTADDLRDALLGSRHDVVFLAGHFNASEALAADYTTRLSTEDVLGSPVDMTNALIFSVGCHSGYNIVNEHGIPYLTQEPDWAQAFARKGATFVGGTGYQYGDTDFLEYSERLYLFFSQQLRAGSGPVSVGQALVQAKQAYLAETPQLRGIHQKALLEATLFGLPMISVDMGGARYTAPPEAPAVGGTTLYGSNPGQTLGLGYADLSVNPALTEHVVTLTDPADNSTVQSLFYSGSDGVLTNPLEPTLPLEALNVTLPGTILRGVGFRGGTYSDLFGVIPFTGAATTEIRGVHTAFQTPVFFPVTPWSINTYGALASPGGPVTLNVTPTQFVSDPASPLTGTMRVYSQMDFRLFYSGNAGDPVGLSAAPSIAGVYGVPGADNIAFDVNVTGNPAVGVQEVWVTYTAISGPWAGRWQSIDLTQSLLDSTRWQGNLLLGGTPAGDVRFLVQAVSGAGLVSMHTNMGRGYIPGAANPLLSQTAVTLLNPPTSGAYGAQTAVSAKLESEGLPLANQTLSISLGQITRQAVTDGSGTVTVTLPITALPGRVDLRATFAGTQDYAGSAAASPFDIVRQATSLVLEPASATGYGENPALMLATLSDATGRRLSEETVIFVLTGEDGGASIPALTDYAGRARLGGLSLPAGTYAVSAYFRGTFQLHTGATVSIDDPRYLPASASGEVTLLNHAPIARDDAYSTNEDTALVIIPPGVLGNDTDADSDTLSASLLTSVQHGTLTLNPDGSFSYTPAANYAGTDSFTYQAADAHVMSNTATATITVNPVNDAPVAQNDTVTTVQNVAATGNVLTNDSDIDSAVLSAVLGASPNSGSLTLNSSGAFTYTPFANFFGTDSFTYRASDGSLLSNLAQVNITVQRSNQLPVCSTAAPSPVALWSPDKKFHQVSVRGVTDPDGDPLTITITGIFQDERVQRPPDGRILATNLAEVRADRDGKGDGRVYHITFVASDGRPGGNCSGSIRVAIVTHDQGSNIDAIDGGRLYNSITGLRVQ